MMNEELEKQLARLTNEVVEENKASWERVISQIEDTLARGTSKYWTPARLAAVRELAALDESALFRVAIVRFYLTISTAQKVGLERGELFLRLFWNDKNQPVFEYCKFGKKAVQGYICKAERDFRPTSQTLLKRLWYETRDKLEPKKVAE